MKRFYSILAQPFNPKTAKPLANPHEEIIDLKENKMFKDVKSILQLKEQYELFWNRPTECYRRIHDIYHTSKTENHDEIIFVQSIRELFPHEYSKIHAQQEMNKSLKNIKKGRKK